MGAVTEVGRSHGRHDSETWSWWRLREWTNLKRLVANIAINVGDLAAVALAVLVAVVAAAASVAAVA